MCNAQSSLFEQFNLAPGADAMTTVTLSRDMAERKQSYRSTCTGRNNAGLEKASE